MTLPTFPAPPGRQWPLKRSPLWRTLAQPSIGGQETRLRLWSYPRWRYELAFDGLRSTVALPEWQALAGLFNQVGGSAGFFAFNDAMDNTVAAQAFGTGDGTTTAFQLIRTLGAFSEPVYLPISPAIFQSNWQGNVLLSPTSRSNLITKSVPLPENGWAGDSGALTSLSATAPDGSGTVGKYVENASTNNGHQITAPGGWQTLTVGTAYTQSIWCKPLGAGSKRWLSCLLSSGPFASFGGAVFDVTGAGSVASVSAPAGANMSASIVAGTGGWFRCCVTATPTASASSTYEWRCASTASDIYGSYTGDGVSGLELWGGQLEANSAVGLYIPTTGSVVSVTDYALGTSGIVALAAAPLAGAALTWSGTYNWLCQFDNDEMPLQQDMAGLWSLKTCAFTTVKL